MQESFAPNLPEKSLEPTPKSIEDIFKVLVPYIASYYVEGANVIKKSLLLYEKLSFCFFRDQL